MIIIIYTHGSNAPAAKSEKQGRKEKKMYDFYDYKDVDFSQHVYVVDYDERKVHEERLDCLAIDAASDVQTDRGLGREYFARGRTLYYWFCGKKTKLEKFDSREEADHACLLCCKWDLDNADNMPRYFYTREEAEAELAEWLAEQK